METLDNKITRLDNKAGIDGYEEEDKAKEKAKKNHNFIQIDKKNISQYRKLIQENPAAATVLTLLVEKMNRQNAVMISYAAMELFTGYKRDWISKAIKHLSEHNWIQIVKIGKSNAYLINSTAFWQSYGNLRYSSFRANIIAIDSEQDKPVEEMAKLKMKTFPIIEVEEEVILVGQDDPPTNEEIDFHK